MTRTYTARMCLTGTSAMLLACAMPAGLSAAEQKDDGYHVFVGLNLSVRVEDKHLPVRKVTGAYIHALDQGRERTISHHQAVAYRMDTDVKVSEFAVSLGNLKAERTYSIAADPRRKWTNSAMDNYVNQSLFKAQAEQKVIRTAMNLAVQGTTTTGQPPSEGPLIEALSDMDQSMTSIPGGDAGFFNQRMQDELEEEMFDAIEVEFSISSPVPLPEPYFVVTAEFKERNKPDILFHWIHAQELNELTPTPQKIRVTKTGFPPGYQLQKYRVNVFSGPRELATNTSEKHMVLSAEEAHLYLISQYENSNRGKDAAPRPLWTALPAKTRGEIPSSEFKRVLLVEVDEDGRAQSIAAEDNEYGPLDSRVIDAVKSFRFYPALKQGKPTPGRLRLQFSEMTRRRALDD